MTINTGIDLVEIDRIEKSIQKPRFLTRFFSEEENLLFTNGNNGKKVETIAGNFSAKEAFSKAIGTGVRDFELREVSILRDELGKPYIKLTGKALEIAQDFSFSVSITHTKHYASAVVVAYKIT